MPSLQLACCKDTMIVMWTGSSKLNQCAQFYFQPQNLPFGPLHSGPVHTGRGGARKCCTQKMEHIIANWSVHTALQTIASNIKGFACKFACKSACASCMNWASGHQQNDVRPPTERLHKTRLSTGNPFGRGDFTIYDHLKLDVIVFGCLRSLGALRYGHVHTESHSFLI